MERPKRIFVSEHSWEPSQDEWNIGDPLYISAAALRELIERSDREEEMRGILYSWLEELIEGE